jgi:NAD(P)-dependent dehydrogenase (short-subunit alcohol dehydrogenase family)
MRLEVVAACREPEHARELEALTRDSGNGRIVRLDVSDPASVRQAAEVIESHTGRVDLLTNCAATGATAGFDAAATGGPLSAVRAEAMLEVFRVNTVGPALVTQALSPLLGRARESRIVNITSDLGSLTRDVRPGSYAYAMSKAALNMLARKLMNSSVSFNAAAPRESDHLTVGLRKEEDMTASFPTRLGAVITRKTTTRERTNP